MDFLLTKVRCYSAFETQMQHQNDAITKQTFVMGATNLTFSSWTLITENILRRIRHYCTPWLNDTSKPNVEI